MEEIKAEMNDMSYMDNIPWEDIEKYANEASQFEKAPPEERE
jgi:hypothetical protein